MNRPSKQEAQQLESLHRQLHRLSKSTHNLYSRMVINGRDSRFTELAREVSAELSRIARLVEVGEIVVVKATSNDGPGCPYCGSKGDHYCPGPGGDKK